MTTAALNRDNWPIAAAMINFPGVLPDGSLVQEQSVDQWAATLQQVVDAGFTELDPTDSWLRVADLSPSRLREFQYLVKTLGLTIPAISTTRRSSVIDPVTNDLVVVGTGLASAPEATRLWRFALANGAVVDGVTEARAVGLFHDVTTVLPVGDVFLDGFENGLPLPRASAGMR